MKQIRLAKGEKVFYDFKKLKGKNNDCRIILTTNRIIIYNDGVYYQKKRKVRRQGINEIQRSTITHVEYYIEYLKSTYVAKVIGLVILLAGLVLAALNFTGYETLPEFSTASTTIAGQFVFINDLIYYGAGLILLIIGLVVIFKAKKTLFFRVVSGHVDDYTIQLKKNKYNEQAINTLSTKLYIS